MDLSSAEDVGEDLTSGVSSTDKGSVGRSRNQRSAFSPIIEFYWQKKILLHNLIKLIWNLQQIRELFNYPINCIIINMKGVRPFQV